MFFCKQKTAYGMRISDWSSDVCSSDLQVLIATERRPNSDGLGLEERGIVLARNGGIVVDDHLETSVPGIYAAGDVTGRDQFVYMAAYGAKLAARHAVTGKIGRASCRERVWQ